MNRVDLLLAAEIHIQQAYEKLDEGSAGRGEDFLESLSKATMQIAKFPNSGTLIGKSLRRMLVPNFPYGVFYKIETSRIVVTNVLDLRQDPTVIRRLLGLT